MPNGKKSMRQRKRRNAKGKGHKKPSSGTTVGGMQNVAYPVMGPGRNVLGGFPSEHKATLKYVEIVSLNPASNSSASNQFRLNSLFDPNETGTGHQPSQFDRWMQIYNSYSVSRTRVRVTQAWNSTSSIAPSWMGFLVSASGSQVSGFSTVETLMEQPYVKYAEVGVGLSNTTPYTGPLTASIDIGAWEGVHGDILKTTSYSGDASTSPTIGPKLEVFLYSFGTASGTAVPVKVELEFDCVFFLPKITLPSLMAPRANKQAGPKGPTPPLAPEKGVVDPLAEEKEPYGGPSNEAPKLMGSAEAQVLSNSRGWFG